MFVLLFIFFVFSKQSQYFSNESDVTLAITSCNRLPLLTSTLAGFFAFNDYPLREIRIVDDCSTEESDIRNCFPEKYRNQRYHIHIEVNQQHLGQFPSIDRLYKNVKTKYLFHLEDDFQLVVNTNFIRKSIDVLEYAQKKSLKISQVLLYRKLSHHFKRSELQWTDNNVSYFKKTDFVDHWDKFSFNPHLLPYNTVYKGQLSSSIIDSVGEKCSRCMQIQRKEGIRCTNCFEPQLSTFLHRKGYFPVVLDTDNDIPPFQNNGNWAFHVGFRQMYIKTIFSVVLILWLIISSYRFYNQYSKYQLYSKN